ncbi:hypothetical protein Tco_1494037 [Tanacetum coccineum]
MNNFKLICGHGRWAIPLDKGLFGEISGIDSSWGESVHSPFCRSGKSKGKNSEHDYVFRDSGNIESANDVEDPINVGVFEGSGGEGIWGNGDDNGVSGDGGGVGMARSLSTSISDRNGIGA